MFRECHVQALVSLSKRSLVVFCHTCGLSRILLSLTTLVLVADSGQRQSPVVFSVPAVSSVWKLTEVAWALSVKEGALPLPEAETKFAYLWNCRAVLDQAARIILATDNDAPGQVPTRLARPVHLHPSQSSSRQFSSPHAQLPLVPPSFPGPVSWNPQSTMPRPRCLPAKMKCHFPPTQVALCGPHDA